MAYNLAKRLLREELLSTGAADARTPQEPEDRGTASIAPLAPSSDPSALVTDIARQLRHLGTLLPERASDIADLAARVEALGTAPSPSPTGEVEPVETVETETAPAGGPASEPAVGGEEEEEEEEETAAPTGSRLANALRAYRRRRKDTSGEPAP